MGSVIEVPWPECGERRKEVRKNPRNQWEQQLAESLRGKGKETVFGQKVKKPVIYEWD